MNFDFSPPQQALYELVGYLARERFAARALERGVARELPLDNLRDLHEHGLLGLTIAKRHGGGGSGVLGEDPVLYLLAIEQVARVDLSTAHCLHIHLHAAHLIDQVATPAQRERLLAPVLARGALLGAVGSEPGRTARGIHALQTTAQRLPEGFVLNGRKNYATLADAAEFLIVFALQKGEGAPEGHVGLAVPRGAKGLRIVPDSWDPLGMRAAVSPDVILDDVFVDEQLLVAAPGLYPRERWQARHYLSLAAQYLGACEGLFDRLTDYLPRRGTAGDGFTQLRLGEMRVRIDAVRWLIYRAAWMWAHGDQPQAELQSMVAKHHATTGAVAAMDAAAQIGGASAMQEGEPLARMLRDLRVHTLHSSVDKTAATIGKYHLGQSFDISERL